MPRVTVELPQVGESVVEGVIGKWLKKPGDPVQLYESLVEVTTDKVTMEVPSPVEGVLVTLLAQEGETVAMGAAIAELEAVEASAPRDTQVGKDQLPIGTTGVFLESDAIMTPFGPRRVEEEAATPPASHEPTGDQRLSPVVRRIMAEHGITAQEAAGIPGSGVKGRVTKEDLLKYVQTAHVAAVAPPLTSPPRADSPPASAPTTPGSRQEAPAADEEWVPLTPVRRRIAENMVRSATEIPLAWTMVEVDVTGLVRWREAVKEDFERREGVELTYLPYIVRATVESLKEHPFVNSSWGDDKIILKKRVNIGIAVAAPQGLVVPVVHDADRLSMVGLATSIRDMVERARQNKLTLEDLQNGTFTVNNTGVLGSLASQPIINYPEAAILTTEAIVRRPVVVDEGIAIRHMMNICVSFDHRILDGAQIGAFMQAVRRRIEAVSVDAPPG